MKKIFYIVFFIVSVWMMCIGEYGAYYQIEIAKKENQLILYMDGKREKVYSVATGRDSSLTPEGTFPLGVKIKHPGWKHIRGGDPKNPLGPIWLGFSADNDADRSRMFGIHGTNRPRSIGKYASSGCIRMRNEEVVKLSDVISEGTPIWIHNGLSTGEWKGDALRGVCPIERFGCIVTERADILSGCSRGSFRRGELLKGESVTVVGAVKDWYQIKHTGEIGFVHKANVYLEKQSENRIVWDKGNRMFQKKLTLEQERIIMGLREKNKRLYMLFPDEKRRRVCQNKLP